MGKKNDQDSGLHIEGGVHTGGGDFVGRDKVVTGRRPQRGDRRKCGRQCVWRAG